MSNIPVYLTAEKHHLLLVGATSAAMAKLALFMNTGVRITLVGLGTIEAATAAGLSPEQTGVDTLSIHDRPFAQDDLNEKTLVYIGVEDDITEERILRLANARKMPVNVIDKPAKSNFITPAQFTRGPLQVAFSSGGVAPVFVRRLRSSLERILPLHWVFWRMPPAMCAVKSNPSSRMAPADACSGTACMTMPAFMPTWNSLK